MPQPFFRVQSTPYKTEYNVFEWEGVRDFIVQFSRAFKDFWTASLKHKRERPLPAIFRLHAGSFLHSKSMKIDAHELTNSFTPVFNCSSRDIPPRIWRYLKPLLNGKCKRLVFEVSLWEVNKPTTRNTRDANDFVLQKEAFASRVKFFWKPVKDINCLAKQSLETNGIDMDFEFMVLTSWQPSNSGLSTLIRHCFEGMPSLKLPITYIN